MKVNTPLLIGACLMLVLAVVPTQVAAHRCQSNGPGAPSPLTEPSCGPCTVNENHEHVDLVPLFQCTSAKTFTPDNDFCDHGAPHSHTYGTGGSAGARSDTVTGGDDVGAGVVTVSETNVAGDCNGDGVPGDYDGDWETGVGGGFFGHGAWRHEPTCNYYLESHNSFVVVNDGAFGGNVYFTIGADDTSGPAVDADGNCSTDGSITPGDPATDPTADADDCLTDTYLGSGQNTCGGGGDGGFWVFLNGVFVDETGGQVAAAAPTAGTITA